jgi:hypothetical protein
VNFEELDRLRQEVKVRGQYPLRILSDSMEPILQTHKEYLVRFRPYTELKPYDIAVFLEADRLMAHLLWYKSEHQGHWITKAYRYPGQQDSPLSIRNYLGVIEKPTISRLQILWLGLRAWWKGVA